MGFDDSFRIPVSDTRAYKQFGNSVVVNVMLHAAQLMERFIVGGDKQLELPLAKNSRSLKAA
jgi:DNA (cytosine-5)-methyltransferase 1